MGSIVESINFEFLRERWPSLAEVGGFAEAYAHPDPQSAVVKMRTFAELMVGELFKSQDRPIPPKAELNDLLRQPPIVEVVPRPVLDKLHAVRINGNKGAHGEKVSQPTALWLLRECYHLASWMFLAFKLGERSTIPDFQEPPPGGKVAASKGRLQRENKDLLQRIAEMERQVEQVKAARPAETVEPDSLELILFRAEPPAVSRSASERSANSVALAQSASSAASELHFDEATTRKRLIDTQLIDAGWKVGSGGANTDEVTQEHEVQHQPTSSGLGYADYVLWDDNGLPLAVIEAKKTAESVEKGQTQARIYADGLEKMTGQRPVIFFTNGFDIWVWDDAQGYPPRELFGFYSKDSLQYLVHQRHSKQALDSFAPKKEIVDRLYQQEAIKRVTERFTGKRRKSLLVQATGTGKTRVAVALTELLIRAGWVKRVLFLCDRRELRKQAYNAFGEFIDEPRTRVSARTAKDRDKRLYFATYPAMLKVFQSFDVGFFDLIIADESHRSIYNVYGDLFRYFDCLQVGLTATPVEYVVRNTFRLFDCDPQHPTFNYPYERAVEEKYLVPFEVIAHQTEFLRRGIKYDELTDEQREQLEDQGEDPTLFNYEATDVDKRVYNRDTNRHILRNLMENGIRDTTGQLVGKTIVFARGHEHAVLMRKVFDELYPQYGGKFCQVIDNYDPRAEQLIDDFKDPSNELTIAISVDMLDTGIDVPEVVNLVFAKPVFSKVKFWQMIGRGTRLCRDLFGPGLHKQQFRVFDHWGNFDYFEFRYQHKEPNISKPLLQLLFEARIDLADIALRTPDPAAFEIAIGLLHADINNLPEESIAVREKWRTKRTISQREVLRQFDPGSVATLRTEIAPLMQWVNIRGESAAREFDLLVARMQIERLKASSRFDDLRIRTMDLVTNLQMHLNPVREKAESIVRVKSREFWDVATVSDLEWLRIELRLIIHHQSGGGTRPPPSKIIDVTDSNVVSGRRSSSMPVVEQALYKKLVEDVLTRHFDQQPVLRKIRRGEPVSPNEIAQLTSLVLAQNPDVNLTLLKEFFPNAGPLDHIIRTIVGLEPDVVATRFAQFVQLHPDLTAKQMRFLSLLQNHIAKYGAVEIERLYEDPFTVVDADGLDGVFDGRDANEIVRIIETFAPSTPTENVSQ